MAGNGSVLIGIDGVLYDFIISSGSKDLLAIREAVSKEAKPSNLCELSGDVTVPISLIRTISER